MTGTRTPIVSGGEILGHWDKPDNALLRFLLQHRLPGCYGVHNLKPGHPIYESIRAEVLAEKEANEPSEREVLDSIDALIDTIRHEAEEDERADNARRLAGEDAGAEDEDW